MAGLQTQESMLLHLQEVGFKFTLSYGKHTVMRLTHLNRRPGLDHIFIPLSPTSFIAWASCPHLRGNSFSLGTNVTVPSHLS